jgi:hypothetical protein
MNPDYECEVHGIPMDEVYRKQLPRNLMIRTFRCPVCGREKKSVEYGWTG